jgi:Kef-type K+ transport system membrane component KefB
MLNMLHWPFFTDEHLGETLSHLAHLGVLFLMFISLFIALIGGGSSGTIAVLWILVKMAAFFGLAIWLGLRMISRVSSLIDRLPISEGVIALAIVVTLLYVWAAEALGGVAAITGAFMAGLAFARTPLKPHIESGMHTLAYSWLVPIFFSKHRPGGQRQGFGARRYPIAPDFRASITARVSSSAPRLVLMSITPGFIRRNASASIR